MAEIRTRARARATRAAGSARRSLTARPAPPARIVLGGNGSTPCCGRCRCSRWWRYPTYGRGFVNTDALWSLVWGRQIAHLEQPDFAAGPTAHPFSNLIGVVLSPLGAGAEPALHALGYLAIGGVIYATALIARHMLGLLAAVVAAGLVATRLTVQYFGALAFVDILFAAVVLWAVVLELRQPRRGTSVVVLLTVAGMLRPEAWVLAGAYVLYAAWGDPRRIVALGALAALAPAAWVIEDLLVMGDPVFSFTHTRDATPATGRPHGLAGLVRSGPDVAADSAHWSVLLLAAGGVAVALWSRRARLPLAALAATLVASALPVLAGTPLNDRYFVASLALGCAVAAGAVAVLARRDAPAALRAGCALCVVVLLATGLDQARELKWSRDRVADLAARRADARSLVDGELPCEPLVVPNLRAVAPAAVWRATDPTAIRDGREPVARGSYLWGTPAAMDGIVVIKGRPGAAGPEPDAPVVARAGGWTLRARCS